LFISPELFPEIKRRIENHPDLTYHAVTKSGNLETNAQSEGPNAVTWGVFPGKEIVQPTIVERISFLAWKDEAFQLGTEWARCYEAGSPSRLLLDGIMNTWYLVNIGRLVLVDLHSLIISANEISEQRLPPWRDHFRGLTGPGGPGS
jgi:methylenetetrahydrofolate reductase (NADPH)